MAIQRVPIRTRAKYVIACPTCAKEIDVSGLKIGKATQVRCMNGCRDAFSVTVLDGMEAQAVRVRE